MEMVKGIRPIVIQHGQPIDTQQQQLSGQQQQLSGQQQQQQQQQCGNEFSREEMFILTSSSTLYQSINWYNKNHFNKHQSV